MNDTPSKEIEPLIHQPIVFREYTAFLEKKRWFKRELVDVSVIFRTKLFVIDRNNRPLLVDFPENICTLNSGKSDLTLEWRRKTFKILFLSPPQKDDFMVSIKASISRNGPWRQKYSEDFFESCFVMDPSENSSRKWSSKTAILDSDAVISLYDNQNELNIPSKIMDLQHLLGIFQVQIDGLKCPSGSSSNILPLSLIRLVFLHCHYIFCFRTKKEMNNWIERISFFVKDLDLYPASSCIGHSEITIKIQILGITSESVNCFFEGQTCHLLILFSFIQFCMPAFNDNPVLLSVEESLIKDLKKTEADTFLLITNDVRMEFKLD